MIGRYTNLRFGFSYLRLNENILVTLTSYQNNRLVYGLQINLFQRWLAELSHASWVRGGEGGGSARLKRKQVVKTQQTLFLSEKTPLLGYRIRASIPASININSTDETSIKREVYP